MRVMVVEDQELAAAIREEWAGVSEDKLVVSEATIDDVLAAKRVPADLIFYPSWMLGHLAEKELIRAIDEEHVDAKEAPLDDLLHTLRNRELAWGGKIYALPLGSPTPVLMYRSDVFKKLDLQPPTTWEQLAATKMKLDSYIKANQMTEVASFVEPNMGEDGVAAFLARAASYCRREGSLSGIFDYATGVPLVDRPPFERALDEFRQVHMGADQQTTFDSARTMFTEGKALMAITWPVRTMGGDGGALATGYAALPGSAQHFNLESNRWVANGRVVNVPLLGASGRIGSLTHEARRLKQATQTLSWLTGRQIGSAIGSRSRHTTLFRRSQLGQVEAWLPRRASRAERTAYSALASANSQQSLVMFAFRLPRRKEYLAELSSAIKNVLTDKQDAKSALRGVAKSWTELAKTVGVQKQRELYQRSYFR